MLKLSIVVSLLLATPIFAGLQSGQTLPSIEISGESGGLVAGGAWKSQTLVNKVHVLFYVDPDEKESNLKLEEALSDAKFPRENYQSVAIINMAATWLPNFAIASSLESKQKKYPNTIYVKDLTEAILSTLKLPLKTGQHKTYELGGENPISYKNFVQKVLQAQGKQKRLINIPLKFIYFLAKLFPGLNKTMIDRAIETINIDVEKSSRDLNLRLTSYDKALREILNT